MQELNFWKRVSRPMLSLWIAVFGLSLVLASANAGLFASPDETAVSVSIVQIAEKGSAGVAEPLARQLPWLHPRSYVAVGEENIPVGFLGWPWWLAQISRVAPSIALPWIASLIAACGIIPWSFLLRRRYGPTAAWWGTALAWLFPPVLLYLNRSYFGHLPQFSLLLWAWWLWVQILDGAALKTRLVYCVAAGVLVSVGISFRSVEAIWMLPLLAGIFYTEQRQLKQSWSWSNLVWLGIGMMVGCIPTALVQTATYGDFWRIGYWLQGNIEPSVFAPVASAPVVMRSRFTAWMPYGFHPNNIIWNIRSFFLMLLWPWTLLLAGSGVLWLIRLIKQNIQLTPWFRAHWPLILGFAITGIWTFAVYGSGLYTDHVRLGAVTIGNSFLRYTLILVFMGAWFVASVYAKLPNDSLRKAFAVCSTIVLGLGLFYAFAHDDEGLLATRAQLRRYQQIQVVAQQNFSSTDIILSERSDKIFFPSFRAVSPLPSMDQRKNLAITATSSSIGLFSAPLSFTDRDDWRKIGYDVREIQTFDRERLYRLTPFSR